MFLAIAVDNLADAESLTNIEKEEGVSLFWASVRELKCCNKTYVIKNKKKLNVTSKQEFWQL